MSEYKLFAQRVGLIGATNFIVSLNGLILIPILTKTLPIEDYGIWAQITVTIALIPSIVMFGLPYTMIRFLSGYKKKEDIREEFYSITTVILISSLLTLIVLFLFSESIAMMLFDGKTIVAKILSFIVFIECLNSILLCYFRTFQYIKTYSVFNIIQTYLNIIVVAYLVLGGYGIIGAVSGILITKCIIFSILAIYIISNIGVKIPKFKNMKDYLVFGLPTIPGHLSSWVINSSDRYVIGIFLGTAFVGYYSPAYALGCIVQLFMTPLGILLPTVLSKYYDEGKMTEVKIIMEYSLKYFLMLAIPSSFGLSFLSKPMLMILSTPEIASEGYLITPYVAFGSVFFGASVIISYIIVLEKKTVITGAVYVLAAISNFGFNLILIPYMGIVGAAVATMMAYLFLLIIGAYYSLKYLKLNVDIRFISKSIFASMIMSLVTIRWTPISPSDVLVTIMICAIVYVMVLLLLRGVTRAEMTFFKNLFIKR